MEADGPLTPAQRRVVDDLLARHQPRPSFDPGLADGLRRQLEDELAPLAEVVGERPLRVAKHALTQVHTCEANYLAELDWDGWNLATAQGEVSHRAIQLSVSSPTATTPLELVDHAMATAAEGAGSLAGFLATLPVPARGELRARVANALSTFLECWPPLLASWWPRTELPVRAELCGGRVVLSGKVDLALGRAHGLEARGLFVDLKTGGQYPAHLDDLRFYALVQALRIGVPPFRVATYYLEAATFVAEDVTVETLEIAARRTVDGARKMAELRGGLRPPTVTPCPRCRYCRIRDGCEGAAAWEGEAP